MIIDVDAIFKYKKQNSKKLLSYGFCKSNSDFFKNFSVMEDRFFLTVNISSRGEINYCVTEKATGEEYLPIKIKSASGGFIGNIKNECEKILAEISKKCYDDENFKLAQSKRITEFIKENFNISPEFLWQKYPTDGVFRRPDSRKWFAIIMEIQKNKVIPQGLGSTEIINMKASIKTVESLLKTSGFYPAYHMNKKHWFTICLDDSLSDDVIFKLLAASYDCTKK